MTRKGIPRPTGSKRPGSGKQQAAGKKTAASGRAAGGRSGTGNAGRKSSAASRSSGTTAASGRAGASGRGSAKAGKGRLSGSARSNAQNRAQQASQRRPKPSTPAKRGSVGSWWTPRPSSASGAARRNARAGARDAEALPTSPFWALMRSRSFRTGVVAAIALAIALYGGYNIYRSISKAMESLSAQPEHIGVGASAPPIVECKPADLKAEFVDAPTTITAGSPWTSTLRLTNMGTSDCLYNGSDSNFALSIKSGDVPTASTVGCNPDAPDRPLLFAAGQKWETSLAWDGKLSSNCTSGAAAEPGTYVVTFALGGEPTETNLVLTLTKPAQQGGER